MDWKAAFWVQLMSNIFISGIEVGEQIVLTIANDDQKYKNKN